MISDVHLSEDGPIDRLTRICDDVTKAFDAHPEHHDGDKCIVFLDDGERGGLVIHGYDDTQEALVDLLMHMKAMFQANGKRMDLVFMDEKGVTRG
jgi:hypothetical protein